MNRTPLKRKTPLKRGKPINRYSLKKIAEINGEFETRLALCDRANGFAKIETQLVRRKGVTHEIRRVTCLNGLCECGLKECGGKRYPVLEPHEKKTRAQGGKLSMENTIMVWRECHQILQGNVLKVTPMKGNK